MSKLSWGKPLVEFGPTGAADAVPAVFTPMPTIEEDTAQLTTEDGAIIEAFGEGHERVAAKAQRSRYKFTFNIFVESGEDAPLAHSDGVVAAHQCVRLTPEDTTLEGFIMRKCLCQVATEWSSKKGKMLKYTFLSLTPETGDQLEDYTKAV
jgi:hypothetical protein